MIWAIAGFERNRFSIFRLREGATFRQEVVDHQIRRSRRQSGRPVTSLSCRRGESPGIGKLGVEEHGSVQFDSVQYFGKWVHSTPLDYQQTFKVALQLEAMALDLWARTGDARAWSISRQFRTIVACLGWYECETVKERDDESE